MTLHILCCLLFSAWAIALAVGDCRSRRVPNRLVLFGLGAALGAALLHAGPARIDVSQSLRACVVGCAMLMPFFLLGVMGAGDVKAFAVLGAWCGLPSLFGVWIAANIAAGVHAVALLIVWRKRNIGPRLHGMQFVSAGGMRSTPYAGCLAVSSLIWVICQFWWGGAR